MKIYHTLKEFNVKNPIITVGTFDGVHLGHKKILDTLNEEAKNLKGESLVFTLHPHPRKVIFPNQKNIFLLNTLQEKIHLIENTGIEHLIIYPFSKEFSNLSSCDFVEKILYNKLNAKKLIVGYDHHFGKDRQGDLEILRNCTHPFGFDVQKVDALVQNKEKISSTKIRNAIINGEIEKASSFLDYNYFINGKVVSGNKIGRTIGFPTANIETDKEKLIPKKGVYAVTVNVKNREYKGMINIGTRPTISSAVEISVEVHIFDFNEYLYGETIKVNFIKFIRDEIKFIDKMKLKEQLFKDKQQIEKHFLK